MIEELVSIKTALLASDKGFKENVDYCYDINDVNVVDDPPVYNVGDAIGDDELFAPTQSLLQKWLREVHNIHIDIRMIEDEEDYEKMTWTFQVITKNLFGDVEYGDFNSYEESLEVGLQEALKLIEL